MSAPRLHTALICCALTLPHATASGAELPPLSQQDIAMVERLQLSGSIGTALLQLGDLYRDGEITAADGQRALGYYMRMAGSADPSAITVLLPANGFIRENGNAEADGQAAAEIYTEALSVGQADALLRLGDLYSDGNVVPQNLPVAFDYYWQAASSGSDTGKLRLGEMLITGSGAERDVVTGLALVQEVAHAGNPNGLILLGDLLVDGRLGAIDATAAIANYEQAGDLGRPDAWIRLGDLFRNGSGIAKDTARALVYYQRAMDAGDLAGTLRFGELLIQGEGISPDIPRGLQLINAAAEDNNVDAFTLLGDIYSGQVGTALPVDFALAFQHYQRAVNAGSDSAKLRLGEMLARGEGVAQDRARGLQLLGEAAATGNVRAYLTLADIQLDAAAGPIDVPAALTALEHAGNLGDPVALLRLGDLLSNGQLVATEPAKALQFYRNAMAAGSQTAQLRVGEMLARGEGAPKDFAGGTALVRQIATSGSASGYLLLGDLLAGAAEPDGADTVAAYEQAAALGRKDALLRLGDLYRDGKIVARDGQRAVAYYLEAAAGEPAPPLAGSRPVKALLATGAALALLAYCLLPAASSLAQATPATSADAAEDLLRRADAQLRLAEIFEQGEGVAMDLARARLHYEQSAHAGSDTAKLRLGQMLVAGLGGPRDTSQGLQLIRSIAGAGNSNAQALLGDLLSGGTLGYVDADGAIAAYQQAANGGSVAAMLSLGDVFRSGAIVAVDLPKSFDYYAAAAASDSASARLALAEMRASGQGVAQDAASGLATLRAGAAKGDGDAAMALGDLLLAGDAGQIDAVGAIKAYETAATGGRTDAYLRLGDLFRDGYYTRRNAERAVFYYQMAANAGENYGLYSLGAGYLDRDFDALGSTAQGMDLVQRAGTAGNQYAVTAIAGAYLFGQGVDADIERGLAILAEAAAAGNTVAALDLVAIYRDGLQRNGKLLLRRREQVARQTLASVQDQIDRGSYLYQTLLLDAVPDGFADPQKALGQLAELSSRDRRSLVVRLLAVNPNAFVTLVQLRLKELGHLDTRINGRLNRQTIRAINAYCRLKAAQDICRMGPLSVATARVLSSAF